MNKVKIFGYNTKDNTKEEIEKEINEFIKDKNIIDIKFNTDIATLTESNFDNIQIIMVTIMIVYAEVG